MITFFIIVLTLVGIALIFLSISILIKRGGRFPEIHIGRNKQMREKGIHCANTTDANDRKDYKPVEIKEEDRKE